MWGKNVKRLLMLCAAGLLIIGTLGIAPQGAQAAKGGSGGGPGGGGGGGENVTTVRWGPFDIPAATADGPGAFENVIVKDGGCSWIVGYFSNCLDMNIEKPCEDCYVTRIVPNLVESGTDNPVNYHNGGMLHHVVNVNFSRDDTTCQPSWWGDSVNQLGAAEGGNQRYFASGNERTVMSVPDGYGYYIGRGDEFGLIADLMNMTPQARQYDLVFTFTWVKRAEPVTPMWFDVDNCADSEIATPAGQSDTHWDWTSNVTGQIVSAGGHVHDYGVSLAAENASTGQNICTSRAGYAEGGVGEPVGPGTGADVNHPSDWWHMAADDHPTLTLDTYRGHIAGHEVCEPNVVLNAGETVRLHMQANRAEPGDHDMGIMIAYIDEV